ncbi:MAG: DNA recombination protein RmuC [Firmicutes bacterium]|nr:DNA recombination protein RmuC [Bacillota bacterium]
MQEYLGYILAGLVFIMAVVLIIAITKIVGMEREIRESRRETAQTLAQSYASINQALADDELATEQRLEYLRNTMENRLIAIQGDNNRQLERMRQVVDEKLQTSLDEKLTRSFDSVRQSLQEVYKGIGEMQNLAAGVGDLKKVLSNVKSRGILGEIQLGSILEQILAPSQYEKNVATVPGSSERVEFAVKMPGDGESCVLLPIDAKFPGDSYSHLLEAYESADPERIAARRRILVSQLKKEAKDIQSKYVQSPYTTEFAVMFLPFEGLYAEAVNMGVMEELQRSCHVMIAGPSTMSALLNSLQMGFKTLAIQQNAGEVWRVLGSVKSEFDKFAEVLDSTQKQLDQANKNLDKLVGTRTRAIQRTLKDVQRLGDYPQDAETDLLT